MSTPTPMKKPRRPPGPVVRLDSFSNPTPRPPPRSKKIISEDCPNPECKAKNSGEMEDGKSICNNCGTVISEGNLVSEVTYGLAAGGSHVVHGFHVAADQSVPNRAANYNEFQRKEDSRAQTETAGQALGMQAYLRDMGVNVFKLHVGGFIQGRRIKSVAAVALYIACRRQTDGNRHMLIDFADVLQLDVFSLGHIYKEMLKHIKINGSGAVIQPINPEDLVLRFAQQLEFGSETMKVAKDTVRLVQRMDRDWMTPGRRPAGVCGAALILAARMNNFRRTVREVVYIVKVQEQTILNRLEEFKATESSGLTVDEFRTIDLERAADPPIFIEQREGKRKHGRKRQHLEFDDDGDNDQPTVISSRASSTAASNGTGQVTPLANTQQAQIDSQNMPPPPLPIDPALETASPIRRTTEPVTEASNASTSSNPQPSTSGDSGGKAAVNLPAKRRGRPQKTATAPPESQAIRECVLSADLTAALTDPMNLDHATALSAALNSASNAPSPPTTQQEPSRPRAPIPTSQEIDEIEFADDLEVSDCLLTPEEVAIKTRIWTHENRDYLRAQSAKLLKQQLAEANGTARVIVRRRRRKKRMGDMSAYGVGSDDEGRPIAGSPEEAVMKMMQRRHFTKKINYDVAGGLFNMSESSGSRRGSDASSMAGVGSPGSAVRMSGALIVTSPGETTKDVDEVGKTKKKVVDEDEVGHTGSVVSDHDRNEQQKELDTIVGELEEEGIDDDDDDEEEGPRTMYDEDDGDDYGSD
ncbi:transcription factor IIIB 90 kDa subunit, partial [Lecanoromycetidae sp. Uapishka_2]